MQLSLPPLHQTFLDALLPAVAADPRFDAVLGAGSLIHGGFDAQSDIDFVLVVADAAYDAVMAGRQDFAAQFPDFLTGFTGEHVGEPRLLICLYGPPLLHVDFKFVRACDLDHMVERPVILWARNEAALTAVLDSAQVQWPDADAQWFEDRVWVWLHYGLTKLRRGELFEAIGMLAFLQERVLGAMLHRRAGLPQRGVRRVEQKMPQAVTRLREVHAGHDTDDIARALRAAVELYLDLRADQPPQRPVGHMPHALLAELNSPS